MQSVVRHHCIAGNVFGRMHTSSRSLESSVVPAHNPRSGSGVTSCQVVSFRVVFIMSWAQTTIEEKPYLVKLVIESFVNIKFFLSDLESLWKEDCSVREALARAGVSNRYQKADGAVLPSSDLWLSTMLLGNCC